MSPGTGPNNGMPAPISIGTRVMTYRLMKPDARNRWMAMPRFYICMLEAARSELRHNFGRFARHLLNHTFDRREIERTAAQHNTGFLP
jgi:hypothetical protein